MEDPLPTPELRRQAEREIRAAKLKELIEDVISRAPELTMFRTRTETDRYGSALLREMRHQMSLGHPLTDLQVEAAQKLVQQRIAQNGEPEGSAPCPDGIVYIKGYVKDLYRQSKNLDLWGAANRPKLVIQEDRGFIVRITCPIILIDQVGKLANMIGWRVGFGMDIRPTDRDPTVGQLRPKVEGGDGRIIKPMLLGRQFEEQVNNALLME